MAIAASPADAAELNVIAAGAVRGVVGSMIETIRARPALKFNFTIGPTGQLRDAIASGKPADLVIVSAPLMAEMEKTGRIAPGSRIDLGRRRTRRGGARGRAGPGHLDARSREGRR